MRALTRRLLVAGVALGAIAAAGGGALARNAQEPAAPPAPTTTPTPAPTPTPTADPDRQLEEFVPTEELPADEAVAFPVDI